MEIPKEVIKTAKELIKQNHKTYLVGGCVRDLATDRHPNDWDIATDAKPEDIQNIFEDSVYENDFGTVGIKTDSEDPTLKIIEVTTFRVDGKYSDNRHPDEVTFAKTIEEDLSRRDFTINAMAVQISSVGSQTLDFIDPYGGRKDLKNKIIRAVGDPEKRFEEDALRLLRAVRFSAQLDFEIEEETKNAILKKAHLLKNIASERIRDEFQKLIMTQNSANGVFKLEELGLLEYILPELREGIGCRQNKHHVYTVFEHNVRALEYATKKNYSFEIRLASLLHDSGKPRMKRGEGGDCTFYNHEIASTKIAIQSLTRLKFAKEVINHIAHLIRYHMFYYNVDEVSEAGVRRFIKRVGLEYIDDLLKVREADRIGSKVPKAFPYKLRHLLFMIEKVKHDPIHPKMLVMKGDDIMKLLNINPGPRIGYILSILLERILDDPKLNNIEYLEENARELNKLSDGELKDISNKSREKKDEYEEEIEDDIKKQFHVK